MPYPIDFKLLFSGDQPLMASIDQAVTFVKGNLPECVISKNIDLKVKFIVSELLTNALKHGGKTETLLKISIDHDCIIIEKTDHGNRFSPNDLELPLNGLQEHKALLSVDSFHRIYVIIQGSKMKFICEENSLNDNPSLDNTMEHFGLLIITKSANEFTYHYDNLSGLNTFRALLKFN